MLPGVELARKRRVHHRHEVGTPPNMPSSARLPFSDRLPAAAMDEPTLAARLRLEEKLRGLMGSRRPSPSSSPPSIRSNIEEISTLPAAAGNITTRVIATELPKRRSNSVALQRTGSRADLCAVCLDEVQAKQRVTRLPCSHKYHTECVLPWLAAHSHCPCCRSQVPSSDQLS
ncbi:unnamed protein product [Musa acuminata subsp. malaccensis]|uniref:(wild Malaysian banana) hypothetical protein n=1 Tax=Musa acuminata subsp. malaccensis TaxID=214687 RepID=A0A804IM77_MUSAM|nr:PREDICTED: E3 ubiquitin-protein ligase RING1-like [Musa acuminata subsp. malaccensis]CAG1841506.1 unnamed protein product [Musa acuminata subsp. malaccensis]